MNNKMIRAGERIVYHTGFLSKDRNPEFSKLKRHEALDLDAFATQLYNSSMNGGGVLSQRKVDNEVYEYYFTKSGA